MNWPDGWTVVEGWKGAKAVEPRYHRAPDGLAGRLDDRARLGLIQGGEASYHQRDRVYGHTAPALDAYGDTPSDAPLVAHYRKSTRAQSVDHDETWVPDDLANTLNGFDIGDARTVELVTGARAVSDDGLPLGLDSNRYRCCGNGVVSSVAEWIGLRLAAYFAEEP